MSHLFTYLVRADSTSWNCNMRMMGAVIAEVMAHGMEETVEPPHTTLFHALFTGPLELVWG